MQLLASFPSAALTIQHQQDGSAPSEIQYVAFLLFVTAAVYYQSNILLFIEEFWFYSAAGSLCLMRF